MSGSSQRVMISPILQTLYILISFLVLSYMISLYLAMPSTFQEQALPLDPITPQKIHTYGGYPDEITIGLHIKSFSAFSIVRNSFQFTGLLWFYLYPQTVPLEKLHNFTIEQGRFTHISDPTIRIYGNRMMVIYYVRCELSNPISYKNFPLDSHRIHFNIIHYSIMPQESIFLTYQRNFIFTPDLESFGWQQDNKQARTGLQALHLHTKASQEYPAAVFSIDVSRSSTRYISSTMLPLLLLIYFVMLSFSAGFKRSIKISANGIAAIITYRFVIENISPCAGYYMISDYFFFFALACIFFIFVCNLVDKHLYTLSLRLKHLITLGIHTCILGTTMLILFV